MTGGPGFDPVDALDRELVALTHPPDWVNPVPDGRYNLVAVGGGTAGLVAAIGAARLGGRVALIEGGLMGGDCLSWGCVPSKALLASARAAQAARDAGRYGVRTGPVEVDFAAVMARMRQLRTHIAHHDSFERVRGEGVDTYRGMARFTGPDTLEVGGATLTFARAVVATGARAAIPDVPGLADVAPLTNETVFQLDALPTRLLVLGAGPVGCELGQAFRRFGSDVTLVEQAPRVLPAEDPDASAVLEARLTREGVQVLTSAAAERFAAGSATVRVGGEVREVPFDRVLVAAGRTPNVAGLGLEAAGVRWDAAGVHTNAWLQTDNPRIYASGDVAAGVPRLTHAADETSRRVLRNALFFGRQSREDMVIPRVTYTEPEVAHVGADAGSEVHRYAFAEVDRAILDGDTEGFVKVVVDGGIVVGGTVVGAHAGELIGLLSVAVTSRMPVARLSEAVQPYPTRVDALRRAAFASQQARLGPTARETLATLLRWRR
ncbi:MAG: FAD-dependent oxidoreductase [Alphaproteobacteria bacterium]|nr:FAD-dependent oxidoreductase [Alphaproteobacteria bacterium]